MESNQRKANMVIWGLVITPVILWLAGVGASRWISSPQLALAGLGKAAALSGIAAYCLMPVLSVRHKLIESAFGGLDAAYNLHARMGTTSFWLILAHPLLLAGSGLLNGRDVLSLWNWSSALIITGILGLIALGLLVAVAVYAKIKHQNWIIIHRLFGWLLPLFFVHALLARGQLAANRALLVYLLALGVLGLCAFFYRSVLARLLVKKYRYVVAEANHLTPLITELVLKPLGQPINYQPGQFAYVSLDSEFIDREFHPFSFSTADNGPYVRFTVKQLGDDTAKIKDITPGTPASLEGPYGVFAQHADMADQQVWIAGGVGIVPFLSMARSLNRDSDKQIKLFYAAEKLEDAVFLRELLAIQKSLPDIFSVTIVSQSISGFVTIDMLHQELPRLADYYYLICGPPPMMKALKTGLIKDGVKAWQIITEEFSVL